MARRTTPTDCLRPGRDWLRAFAARKTAPGGIERFALTAILTGDHVIKQAMEARHPLVREILGLSSDDAVPPRDAGRQEIERLIEQASGYAPKRTMLLLAVVVLAA